jgi:Ca-activated chloride channel family protein
VYEGAFPKEGRDNDFIPRLWATRKIGYLLDNIRMGGEKKELVDEVVALSKRYGIVTPYTSYLVTEDTPQVAIRDPGPRPTPRPPLQVPPRPMTTRPGWGDEEGSMANMDGLGTVGGGGRSGGMAKKAPAKARAEERMQTWSGEKDKAMSAQSGATAVDTAAAVREMKEAEAPRADEDDAAGIRYLEGRTFRYSGGGWVDVNFTSSMKTLEVKYLGKAYFALLAKSPKLKRLFTLGERVTIVVGSNLALVISANGRDEVSDAELSSFLPK